MFDGMNERVCEGTCESRRTLSGRKSERYPLQVVAELLVALADELGLAVALSAQCVHIEQNVVQLGHRLAADCALTAHRTHKT